MIQTKINANLYRFQADKGNVITEKGNRYFTNITDRCVLSSDIDKYEEVAAADILPYTKEQYEEKVSELVRLRYTESEEFAIQRKYINAAFSPAALSEASSINAIDEYSAYNIYVEGCKSKAKELLSIVGAEKNETDV